MFRRISSKIALQFTAFVFLLLLTNGLIFLIVDFQNDQRQSHFRLQRDTRFIADHMPPNFADLPKDLPPMTRERVRIVDSEKKELYTGNVFQGIPFEIHEGFRKLTVESEQYTVLTSPVVVGERLVGHIQLADRHRFQGRELPLRALLYLAISAAISAFTFFVGKYFARTSLKPAEQMMERLDQFTQDASHELRTPLATLNSSLDLALKSGKHQEGLLSAKKDVKHISILVERLLSLARLDQFALQHEKINLSELVVRVLDQHKLTAQEKHVTLEKQIDADVNVLADGALIHQVLSNLIANALKFTNSGGTVRVRLTKDQISVSDTGVGINQKDLPMIFYRFYQAEQSRSNGGFGLGLALVKRILDLHGWGIDVESEEGKGTTFTIRFTRSKGKLEKN